MWIVIGTILLIIISFIDYREVKKYTRHIYGICIVLLLVVRFFRKKNIGSATLDFDWTFSIAAFGICKNCNYHNDCI